MYYPHQLKGKKHLFCPAKCPANIHAFVRLNCPSKCPANRKHTLFKRS
nr:MAG TPA: hypothetical protein [Caudoviricetes sp.]